MLGKQNEAGCREYLEDGDALPVIGFGDPAQRIGKDLIVHQPAAAGRAHPVALMPAHEMRRGMDVNA